tara:strand:+ start:5117 stop:5656 length:540 start_codon:yes stop_codon:yes gene_type:complete
MNIFFLAWNPRQCALMHCDKHVIKMILEYAQILCTTHRIIDGDPYIHTNRNGRRIKRWKLSDPYTDGILYSSTHTQHPSVLWARECVEHYNWLYELFAALCKEYTMRYNKIHLCWQKLKWILKNPPTYLRSKEIFKAPPSAMPDYCKRRTSVISYRIYYQCEKSDFAKWTSRQPPKWYK